MPFSTPHSYHTKQLNPWPTQPVVWCFIPGCLHVQGRGSQLNTTWVLVETWQALETSCSKAAWIIFSTNSYLPELLGIVYSYCVHGSQLFIKSSHIILCDMYLHLSLKFCFTYCIKLRFLLFIRECLSTYGHTINVDSDTTCIILPFPWIQCSSSSHYHGHMGLTHTFWSCTHHTPCFIYYAC